jgi:hypothetical protein
VPRAARVEVATAGVVAAGVAATGVAATVADDPTSLIVDEPPATSQMAVLALMPANL